MTTGQLRYAEKIAIGLAVEVNTGLFHRHGPQSVERRRMYRTAARYLFGTCEESSKEALRDMVRVMRMYGYRPTGTVVRAIS